MELITDRTQSDVLLGNKKGVYSYEDLNRVERAVSFLAELAGQLDVHYEPQVKLDWTLPQVFDANGWPVRSQMERYLENVRALCALLAVQTQLPDSMDKLTYVGANRIEQALADVQAQIRGVLDTFQFSGELFAGEE